MLLSLLALHYLCRMCYHRCQAVMLYVIVANELSVIETAALDWLVF